jgi:hypothetical protein
MNDTTEAARGGKQLAAAHAVLALVTRLWLWLWLRRRAGRPPPAAQMRSKIAAMP